MYTFFQPESSRKKGRPGLRWLDSVLKDPETIEENTWWEKAWIEICETKSSRRPRHTRDCSAKE
jgi:hypothetical protein